MVTTTRLLSMDVPRNCADRQTVPSWQQARDALNQHATLLEHFTVSVPIFAYAHSLPTITTHTADANTVALWQGDPPNNGGSGLIDSSGHGKTLVMGAGSQRYGELGMGQLGFLCDGANYWQRAGAVNDASLNIVGDMTIEALVRPLVQPAGLTDAATILGGAVVNYGAIGETGGNDNVFWSMYAGNATVGGPNVPGMVTTSFFWETGAGTNQGVDDQSLQPLFNTAHWAWVRKGTTLTCIRNGFLQTVATGIATGTVGGAPGQFVRIGADHNAAQFFQGVVGSIKISNVARSLQYVYNDASHCLGSAQREIAHTRPVLYITEPCELVEATIIPDDQTGTFVAGDASIFLYRVDSSGSVAKQQVAAKLDGTASSSTAWSQFRAKKMQIPTARPQFNEGDSVCIVGATKAMNGSLTLKFRRTPT